MFYNIHKGNWIGDRGMENKRVCELIELFELLSEKGLDAIKIINDTINELPIEKNIPIKV